MLAPLESFLPTPMISGHKVCSKWLGLMKVSKDESAVSGVCYCICSTKN